MNVIFAKNNSNDLRPCLHICSFTPIQGHFPVHIVENDFIKRVIWRNTHMFTQVRSSINYIPININSQCHTKPSRVNMVRERLDKKYAFLENYDAIFTIALIWQIQFWSWLHGSNSVYSWLHNQITIPSTSERRQW